MPRHAKHHHQRRAKQRATGRNIIVTWYWMIFIDRVELPKCCHIPSIECVSKIQSILSIICHAVCIQLCHCLELGNETVICNLCHSSFLFVVCVRVFVSTHVPPYPRKSQLIKNELSRVWLEKVRHFPKLCSLTIVYITKHLLCSILGAHIFHQYNGYHPHAVRVYIGRPI